MEPRFRDSGQRAAACSTVPSVTPIVASAIHNTFCQLTGLRQQVDRHAGAVDHQANRGGGRDEAVPGEIEPEQCRGPDSALIPDQPAEQARGCARDPGHGPPKAQAAGEPGRLADGREQEQRAKDHVQPAIAGPAVKESPDQSSRRAGQTEAPEDPAIDSARPQPEPDRRANDVQHGDGRDREPRIHLKGEDGREQAADAKPR